MRYFYDTEFIEDGKIIDLISIGIVADDGREFYAVSNEFDIRRANEFVKVNVLPKLPPYNEWESRESIKERLLAFIGDNKPEFWAYYADYDHVALCQLFGKMIDLPKGWPMYTRDLKQLCDDLGNPTLQKQHNMHDALSDARWNRSVYLFLNDIRLTPR